MRITGPIADAKKAVSRLSVGEQFREKIDEFEKELRSRFTKMESLA
jgi:hypothetical protein